LRLAGRGLILFALILLSGCFGRIHDPGEGQQINPKDYGLDETRPALLVFSAAWCKPCMAEIPALNRALSELDGQVQIKGFVVEGAQKGVAAAPKDGDLFVSPGGDRPAYPLAIDSGWKKFDQFKAGAGRSLPTMVFVSRGHRVLRIVQRSLEYDTELLPLLKALISEQAPVAPKPDQPAPDPGAGHPQSQAFADWAARAGQEPGSATYQNVQEAWLHGLGDYGFPEDDMPFETATMTVFIYDDGHSVPISALWIASTTNCRLTVYFKPDGSYDHSTGVCR
jgi:thiol-disulfide isomerase/thioredoxin